MKNGVSKKLWFGAGAFVTAICLGLVGFYAFRSQPVSAQQSVTTQNFQEGRPQRPPQPIENLPELQTREAFPNEPAFKQDCRDQKLLELTSGKTDNFAPGADPVKWSPALAAFLTGKPVRQFDNGNGNAVFGHSFQMETCFEACRLCGAQLEIKTQPDGDIPSNDVVYIYGQNINGSSLIWSGKVVDGTMTVNLPALSVARLNDYLCRNQGSKPWINILTQDDRKVDYVKLRLWYFN